MMTWFRAGRLNEANAVPVKTAPKCRHFVIPTFDPRFHVCEHGCGYALFLAPVGAI